MTPAQIRKLSVLIQKGMMTADQTRLLIHLLHTPSTTLGAISDVYYGPRGEDDKSSLRISYMKKYLKALMLKLEYWGLPHVITINKDQTVKLTMKEQSND